MSNTSFYMSTVTQLHHATADALTITLATPPELKSALDAAIPGQFITIKLSIDNQEHRRTYSINSGFINSDPLQITVKKIPKGLVSNHLHANLKKGDTLQISPPAGNFITPINPTQQKSYFFFVAGSGITPIISMIKSTLQHEPWSYVYLLYGNRNEEQIIFYDELSLLQKNHSDRFTLEYLLSDALSKKWSALWTAVPKVDAKPGRVSPDTVRLFVDTHHPRTQKAGYYICGPEKMITSVSDALLSLDISQEDIHAEYFGGEGRQQKRKTGRQSSLIFNAGKKTYTVTTHEGETLLDTLQRENIDVDYSCQSGVCGTCQAHLKKGDVDMQNTMALSEQDIKQKKILLCQCYPVSDSISINL